MKSTGFGKLQKELSDAQKAMEALDGQLGTVTFTPDDPSSIEAAIREAERTIDQKVGRYASNPFVAPLIEGAKAAYRAGILQKAAAARLESNIDE